MADTNRMRIVVEADNKSANQAFAQTNGQMDQMALHAVKIAQSISQHFQTMAAEIKAAISGLNGAFSGMDSASRRIVDQYGRPIASSQSTPSYGGAAVGAAAAASRSALPPISSDAMRAQVQERIKNLKLDNDFLWGDLKGAKTGMKDQQTLRATAKQSGVLDDFNGMFDTNIAAFRNRRIGFGNEIKDNLAMIRDYQGTLNNSKKAGDAADAQEKLAGASKKTGDNMANSMVNAVLFYEALERGGQIIRSLTVDSALYAAHINQLRVALFAIASSNGVSRGVAATTAERVHRLGSTPENPNGGGITTEQSYNATTLMMAVGMGTKYTVPMAELAQNVGRVRGIPTQDVLQNLVTGAITGRTQELHSMGIMVSAEAEYRKMALSIGTTTEKLTEYQKKQAVVNAILREGAGYANAYKDSMGSLGGKIQSMPRYIAEAKLAVGNEFQHELKTGVNVVTDGLKYAENNPGQVADAARIGVTAAGAAGLLLLSNPIGLVVSGLVAFAGVLSLLISKVSESVDGFTDLYHTFSGSKDLMKNWATQTKSINAERLHEFTAPAPQVIEDMALAIKERDFAKTRSGDMSGLNKMSGKEMAEFAHQANIQNVQGETEWYKKQMDRQKQSQKAVQDSLAAGLEGAHATRAKAEATILEQGMDKEGFQRGLDPKAAANYRTAANNEVNAEILKKTRDLKRDISGEDANQLEGAKKLVAQGLLANKKLIAEGYATKELLNLNRQLAAAKINTMVLEKSRDLTHEIATEEAGRLEGNYKLVALGELEVQKLKDAGLGTDALIAKQNDLTQAKLRSAVLDEARATRDSLEQARVSDKQGYAQIDADLQLKLKNEGRKDNASLDSIDNLNAEAAIKRGALDRQNADETEQLRRDADKSKDSAALESINMAKEAKLASLEHVYTFDLQAKLSAEQQKFAIEMQYMDLISAKKKEMREGDYEETIKDLDKKLSRHNISQETYNDDAKIAQGRLNDDLTHLDATRGFEQSKLLKDSTHAQREMVQQEYVQLYDKLKGSVSSVFDAIFDKNQSVLDALGNALKNFVKKLASDIISTQVTKGLMGAITGQEVQTVSPGAGVMRGGFGGFARYIGGLTGPPVISGGGGMQQEQASPSTGGYNPNVPVERNPDGTVKITGSVGSGPHIPGSEFLDGGFTNAYSDASPAAGGPMTGARANSILFPGGANPTKPITDLMKNNQKGTISPSLLGNLKNTNWGSFTRADGTPGVDGQPGTDHTSGKITGVGGVAGAALQAGGMMLATQGLMGGSRGTWTGVGEGAAGGAMIGLQMGGPLGAAIGGIAGFGIGIGEKIAGVESQRNEAIRLVKQVYGLKINNGMADQIVQIAKSKYGNSVSVAIRSQDARQLLQLFAEQNGQKSNLYLNDPHGVNLMQTHAGLQQGAVYNNGSALTYQSSLSTWGIGGTQIPTGNPYAGGNFTVMVSPEATQNLWATGVAQGIEGNGRRVASANVNGGTASSSRLSGASMMLDPDMVYA